MITINLAQDNRSIDELLTLATSAPLMIQSRKGRYFILEETDNIEKETNLLSNSQNFMEFLNRRSEEKEAVSISAIADKLSISRLG